MWKRKKRDSYKKPDIRTKKTLVPLTYSLWKHKILMYNSVLVLF